MAEDFAKMMNELPGNSWVKTMGLRVTRATVEEVECEWDVDERHHQGYGIVHGGVHCGLIESLASVGAALFALPRGQHVVGLENNTSFIRAVRAGVKLRAIATPITPPNPPLITTAPCRARSRPTSRAATSCDGVASEAPHTATYR